MSDVSNQEGVFEFAERSVPLPEIISPVLDDSAFDWLAENRDLLVILPQFRGHPEQPLAAV
jgi:hypothetical protein